MRRRSASRRDPLPRFSELEARAMRIVWDAGEVTADEVRRALPGALLTDSTVRTLLRRLEAKGYVEHGMEGRRFVYRAAVGRKEAAAEALHRIADRIFGGAMDGLLVGMVEGGVLSRADIERMDQALEALEAREADSDA